MHPSRILPEGESLTDHHNEILTSPLSVWDISSHDLPEGLHGEQGIGRD